MADICINANTLAKAGILLIILVIIMFLLGSQYGHSNIFTNSIIGTGSMEERDNFGGKFTDVASVNNGIVNYKFETTWEDGTTEMHYTSSYTVEALKSIKGQPFSNKYSIGVYSAGYKHRLEATDITGNFTGSANVVTTDVSIDSLIIMDNKVNGGGNATFSGSVINTNSGNHPVTESETLAIGQFAINQYLNVSVPQKVAEDPLSFCITLDKDMILDKSVPDGVYVVPVGYTINKDGKLVKIPEGYTVLANGTLVKKAIV